MYPLRTIGFLGIYIALLLWGLAFPAAAVWGFLFESNYHPPVNPWWGAPLAALSTNWSLIIGAVMIVSTFARWGESQERVLDHKQTILLGLFTLNTFVVTTWAHDINLSWKEASDNLKWLLVYLCIIKTHSNRKWLPVILLIYAIGLLDAGWQTTFQPSRGRFTRGGPLSCRGENFLSPHAIAFLPLLGAYAVSSNLPRWTRYGAALGAPFVLNIVASGQSRGAFLALVSTAIVMPFAARGKLRVWTIAGLIVGSLLCLRLFHDQFWNRISTIESHEDGSATHRIDAWVDAWELSLEFPLGYGGEAFDHGVRRVNISTHSMYCECLVAWGFQGAALWLGYIAATLWDCRAVARRFYRPGQWPQPREYIESVAIFTGMVSMLVASIFLNRMRWEMWWIFPAYVVCLKNAAARLPQQRRAGLISGAAESWSTSFPRYSNRGWNDSVSSSKLLADREQSV